MNKEELKAHIGMNPTCYDISNKALQKWMSGVPLGTEQEAHMLNIFIEVWEEIFRFRDKKSRERREAMIRCGITAYIEEHLKQLFFNNRPLYPSSYELSRYGLYGPDAENPKTKTQKTKSNLMVRDALSQYTVGKSSVRNLAKNTNSSRKTVRKYRKEKDYSSNIHVIQKVLQKSRH